MGLLDKIQNQNQAPTITVEPRPDHLAVEPAAVEPAASAATSLEGEIASLEAELAKYPTISNKKFVAYLDETVQDGIKDLCDQNEIGTGPLLEAFYIACKDKPIMKQVLAEAQRRDKQRTEAGSIRSLITKTRNILKRRR